MIAVLQFAAETGERVRIISAPDASAYLGPGWFRALLDAARTVADDVAVDAYLDCGDRPGDVLAALREGVSGVIFRGRRDIGERLAAMAAGLDIAFLNERPESCDLGEVADVKKTLADMLGGAAKSTVD